MGVVSSILLVSKKSQSKRLDISGNQNKMLSTTSLRVGLRLVASRNLATTVVAPAQAATDPIQQLFAEKVRDYAKKKAAAGGKMPDASKETLDALAMELEKVSAAYCGGAGVDMTKFPDFKFAEPAVEDVPLK